MAQSSTMSLVRKIAEKQQDGTLGQDQTIGAVFTDVVDGERVGATGYSLDQFIDSYMAFMAANPFTYVGNEEPLNHHIALWVDTGHAQNDF